MKKKIINDIKKALSEDIGAKDLSHFFINKKLECEAQIICKDEAILCGKKWVDECFNHLSKKIKIKWHYNDGDFLKKNTVLCEIVGPIRPILSAERVALNFLQFLSGVSTKTYNYVKKISDLNVKIFDTRKTLPNLRYAQKYAVKIGGGNNHRFGLFDAVLIKENHLFKIDEKKIDKNNLAMFKKKNKNAFIQIEVKTLKELEFVTAKGFNLILLDNFKIKDILKAVKSKSDKTILEASGNINLRNIRQFAETGVDRISIGDLTKNINAIDYSLLIES